jgi:glutaminase
VDALTPAGLRPATLPSQGYGTESPLQRFLNQCHAEFSGDHSGTLADYIPELTRANPDHFGVSVATIDGHVYEVGDSRALFTIQSVSKAFVFALALELLGHARVEAAIGVEPSGEAFNSIRLTADNKPFNPMVNAGAIACSGMIYQVEGDNAFERIRNMLGKFAGRDLGVDDSVYASERATGNRNRAIAWLLHNYDVVAGDVDAVLDTYFRQCAVLVTARDLAVMAATLANRGTNPVTGEHVISPETVARVLSVMTSSGMYDYAGEWIYRVGIPAKSGVGGGIVAALPSQIGLGTFSPRLDSHGNSVRGLKMCEALSARFNLHMLNRSADVRTCIIDYVTRRLSGTEPNAPLLILDFRRVPDITAAGARLLSENLAILQSMNVTTVLTGFDVDTDMHQALIGNVDRAQKIRHFAALDQAIEWAEDQVIYRYGGFTNIIETTHLSEQALLADLTPEEIAALIESSTTRHFQPGARIVHAGEPANSIFFIQRGMVSVKLPSGVRLASLGPGSEFGEMALIAEHRTADVWADTPVQCLELPTAELTDRGKLFPSISLRINRNLSALLAKRLVLANAKVDLLSSY